MEYYPRRDGDGAAEWEGLCYFPQIEAIHNIIAAYPAAHYVLNRRPAEHWLRSVDHWSDLRQRLGKCNITGLPAGVGSRDEDMLR